MPNTPESAFTHTKAEHHINAMYAWNQHKRAINSNLSMRDHTNEERKKKVEENCVYIKTIAHVLLLTATQNIAQRGRESDDSDKKVNFLTIFLTISLRKG